MDRKKYFTWSSSSERVPWILAKGYRGPSSYKYSNKAHLSVEGEVKLSKKKERKEKTTAK